jgi:geranylgeranyl diphosphate synthase type II
MQDFDKVYNEFYNSIQNKLFEIANNTNPKSLRDPFIYLIENGGKRLRSITTMLAAGAVGGNPYDALECGVSLEILHNFTLVHDDIMDSAPLRRGKETVHIKWNIPTGILVGDIMIGYACQLVPKDDKILNRLKLQELFMESLIVVCEGQALDMDYNVRRDIIADNYLDMIGKKTANLIRTSILMGAYCGNATPEQISLLEEFSFNLGLAFQIQDDYLDLTSSESGKVIGQDLIEGKKTYMIIRAKDLAQTPNDKELMEMFYKNNGATEDQVNDILEMLERLNIFKEAQELFNNYYELAENALNKLQQNDYTLHLKKILDQTKNRKH